MQVIFNKQGQEMLNKLPRQRCSVCLLPKGDGLHRQLKPYQYETCPKCGNSVTLDAMAYPLAYKVRWVNCYNRIGV